MTWAYYISVSLHVLAAMTWLGGMLFLGLVGAPALRKVEPPQLRQALFRDLVVTGILNLHFRGWLSSAVGSSGFWSTTAGRSLAVKLAAVATMIAISGFHDFVHGPRASRHAPGTPEAIAARRTAMILARINAMVGVLVVLAAVRLARA